MSYKGISTRIEMWFTTGCLLLVDVLICLLEATDAANLTFYLMFMLPLTIRRARQMGAVWYGELSLIFSNCFAALGILLIADGESVLGIAVLAVYLVFIIHFYTYGGKLTGRKNELMRAVIEGNLRRFPRRDFERRNSFLTPRRAHLPLLSRQSIGSSTLYHASIGCLFSKGLFL